ncbi:MAG: ADOP family duplicated permease [Gemmatimonadales bacterium]
MARWPQLRRLFRLPAPRPETVRKEVDAEMDFHLAMRVEELMALGMSEADARAEATRRFGDLTEARAALIRTDRAAAQATARTTWLADLGRDLRFAARELKRNWSFALLAISVLALGIGLATSMVSLFDRLALRPLPYPNADRLGLLWLVNSQGEHHMRITPNQDLVRALAGVAGIERVDGHRSQQMLADLASGPEVVPVRVVSAGLLTGLGARVALGRVFAAEDTLPGAPLAVMLAHRTWRERFAGRLDVLGQSVRLDNRIATVIGVLRPGFDLTSLHGDARAAFWLPLRSDLSEPGRDGFSVLLTLASGAVASEVASRIDARFQASAPTGDNLVKSFKATVLGADDLVGDSFRRTLSMLLGAVGLVVLVACANVAALLLGQAVGRLQEFGVRSALGAGRARVVRQLIAEAGLLGALGGLGGVLVTVVVLAVVRQVRPDNLLTIDEVRVNLGTLGLAGGVAAATVLLFGLAPIWAVSRADLGTAVVGRARHHVDGRGAGRLRSFLVVGQIAVTLTLMLGAGLLLKSFIRERNLPLGFMAEGLAEVNVVLPEGDFPTAAGRAQLMGEIVERARRVPGVIAASMSGNSPIDFGVMFGEFLAEGKPVPPTEAKAVMPLRWVAPDFFAVAGVRLLAGRTFGPDSAQLEIVIDAATAKRAWGTVDVVGKRLRFGREAREWHTIVGVAADLRALHDGFEGVPTGYLRVDPAEHGRTLLLRLTNETVLTDVNRVVREASPAIRIRSAGTALAALDDQLANTRFTMVIVTAFSILALTVAMVGLYGVIAFTVRRRHFEFGVRLALGAPPSRVTGMVLREGLTRIALGMAIGLAGSVALVRVIRGMLYQMSPFDPAVFLGAAGLLVAVGIAAVWLPARQASKVDPLEAIRAD